MSDETPAILEGTLVNYKLTKDNGLLIFIELDEPRRRMFHKMFPEMEIPVVVAALAK